MHVGGFHETLKSDHGNTAFGTSTDHGLRGTRERMGSAAEDVRGPEQEDCDIYRRDELMDKAVQAMCNWRKEKGRRPESPPSTARKG